MMLRLFVVVIFIFAGCLDIIFTAKTTWDECGCYWGDWEEWSECDSDCFGQRRRFRTVTLTLSPTCYEFTHCATNDEGWDYQDCNNVCHNRGVATGLLYQPCDCQPGYYASCCTDRVNCGTPNNVVGGTVSTTSTYYGGKATYTCNTYYNMTSGDSVRTCQNDFSWSGTAPTCIFAYHCNSSPCMNGGSCVNLLGDFRCDCVEGWGGQLCDQDIQPPVMSNCSSDIWVNATAITARFGWTAPEFYDPMGHDLEIVHNYPNPSFTFPWGDHTVQYVATKPSNGMSTECVFQIRVRPTPCVELNVPLNGARVCNNWKTDYGRFCMVACQQNYTLGPGKSFETMYVCGASGNWIASSPMPDCVEVDSTETALTYQPEYTTYSFEEECGSDVTTMTLQNLYLERLQSPGGFSTFCSNFPDECTIDNVEVMCAT